MTEATLKSALTALLRAELPACVVFRHEDKITGGIPDISVTGNKKTTWLEVKYAHPTLNAVTRRGRELQALTAQRLAVAGSCFYIIYAERKQARSVYVVHPHHLNEWMTTEVYAEGFNHQYVVDFLRGVHS